MLECSSISGLCSCMFILHFYGRIVLYENCDEKSRTLEYLMYKTTTRLDFLLACFL